MTFTIVTHVVHIKKGDLYYGYSPYVNEMNIWLKHVTNVVIVAPITDGELTPIHSSYTHKNIKFVPIQHFNFLTVKSSLRSFYQLPYNFFKIFWQLKYSQHIHLRCPGNIGLVACFAQLFFPKKIKTVKYAGNWDLKSKQPLSYKIQKFILNSSLLTKNCKVLVYGKWKNSSSAVTPFFTATYTEAEKTFITPRNFTAPLKFIFVGTLSNGKRPEYAIEIVQNLNKKGIFSVLELYGNGVEKLKLEDLAVKNKLENYVFFKGNQSQEVLKTAYQESHFVILPSKSEGWPKAIAEAMFWGCLPIATKVSCVPYMLQNEERGLFLNLNIDEDVKKIIAIINNKEEYSNRVDKAMAWSRKYTLDFFELKIKKLIQ